MDAPLRNLPSKANTTVSFYPIREKDNNSEKASASLPDTAQPPNNADKLFYKASPARRNPNIPKISLRQEGSFSNESRPATPSSSGSSTPGNSRPGSPKKKSENLRRQTVKISTYDPSHKETASHSSQVNRFSRSIPPNLSYSDVKTNGAPRRFTSSGGSSRLMRLSDSFSSQETNFDDNLNIKIMPILGVTESSTLHTVNSLLVELDCPEKDNDILNVTSSLMRLVHDDITRELTRLPVVEKRKIISSIYAAIALKIIQLKIQYSKLEPVQITLEEIENKINEHKKIKQQEENIFIINKLYNLLQKEARQYKLNGDKETATTVQNLILLNDRLDQFYTMTSSLKILKLMSVLIKYAHTRLMGFPTMARDQIILSIYIFIILKATQLKVKNTKLEPVTLTLHDIIFKNKLLTKAEGNIYVIHKLESKLLKEALGYELNGNREMAMATYELAIKNFQSTEALFGFTLCNLLDDLNRYQHPEPILITVKALLQIISETLRNKTIKNNYKITSHTFSRETLLSWGVKNGYQFSSHIYKEISFKAKWFFNNNDLPNATRIIDELTELALQFEDDGKAHFAKIIYLIMNGDFDCQSVSILNMPKLTNSKANLGDFQEKSKANQYQKENKDFWEIHNAAQKNHCVVSQFSLGNIYLNGSHNVETNTPEAFFWIITSALHGHLPAIEFLQSLCPAKEQLNDVIIGLLISSAKSKNMNASFLLSQLYIKGNSFLKLKKSDSKAIEYCHSAINLCVELLLESSDSTIIRQGLKNFTCKLTDAAKLYTQKYDNQHFINLSSDNKKYAQVYWKFAAAAGNPEAIKYIEAAASHGASWAVHHLNKIKESHSNVIIFLKIAAATGDINAIEKLKIAFKNNNSDAFTYWRLAAEAGNPGAVIFWISTIDKKNSNAHPEAVKCLIAAADKGSRVASAFLKFLVDEGCFLAMDYWKSLAHKDNLEAIRYWKTTAHVGNSDSVDFWISMTDLENPNVNPEPITYLILAANAGNRVARTFLKTASNNGSVVAMNYWISRAHKKDDFFAIKYLISAAQQENPWAKEYLRNVAGKLKFKASRKNFWTAVATAGLREEVAYIIKAAAANNPGAMPFLKIAAHNSNREAKEFLKYLADKDDLDAVEFWKEIASANNPDTDAIGYLYRSADLDKPWAIDFWKAQAKAGNAKAIHYVSQLADMDKSWAIHSVCVNAIVDRQIWAIDYLYKAGVKEKTWAVEYLKAAATEDNPDAIRYWTTIASRNNPATVNFLNEAAVMGYTWAIMNYRK